MTPQAPDRESIIASTYTRLSGRVQSYISTRVNDSFEAENLTQDVWLRLLECDAELEESGVVSLIFTIAHNLVNDYLRRIYRFRGACDEMALSAQGEIFDAEAEIFARDIAACERSFVECLPPQRRTIYIMNRYDDMNVADIAGELDLSSRTVENHLRLGRRDVRSYISAIA